MEKKVEQFCGLELFTWEDWDEQETGVLCFYNTKWLLSSMQKYNGLCVETMMDGTIKIYNEDGTENVFDGCLFDIKEVIEYATTMQNKQ